MDAAGQARPELIAERKARKLVQVTFVICVIVIVVGFGAALYRLHEESFNRAEWDRGKGVLTSSNLRLKMQRDVQSRVQRGMTRKQVLRYLGPPDPVFAVKSPSGGTSQPYQPAGSFVYMLGVSPQKMTTPPMLMFLVVNFDAADDVQYSSVDGVPFQPGDKIVPAKPMPPPSYGMPPRPSLSPKPKAGKKVLNGSRFL